MLNLHSHYLPTVGTVSVFWEADAETLTYRYISPEVERLLGYSVSAWLADAVFWLSHIHVDDRDRVQQNMAKYVAEDSQFTLTYRWQLANGRWVWLEERVQVVADAAGGRRLLGIKQVHSYVESDTAKRAMEAADAIDYLNQHLFVQGTFQERLADSLETLGRQLQLRTIAILENRFGESEGQTTAAYCWGDASLCWPERTYGELGLPKTAVSSLELGETITVTLPKPNWSIVAAPIIHNQIWQGSVLCFSDSADRQWLPIEQEAITIFAQLLSTAFRHVRSYEQTQQQLFETAEQLEEAEALNEIASYLNSSLDLDAVLQQTVDALRRYLADVQSCGLSVLEGEQTIRLWAQWLEKPDYMMLDVGERLLVAETSIVKSVLATNRPLAIADLRNEQGHTVRTQTYVAKGLTSVLYVPIIFQEKPIGLLHINVWHKQRLFTPREIALCEAVANQTAVAIERASLYERLQEHADHLAEEVAARTFELQTERDRTLAILESAGEGILVTDVEAKIVYVNPAIEYQTGYARAALIGQSPTMLLSDQTPRHLLREMWKMIRRGKMWSGELVGRRKNGSLYDLSMTITPTHDADGAINSFVSVQADISRLKEIDRLKSEFVSNVSHELRTPLTNIKTYLTLLERGRPEKFPRYIEILNHESLRLERLIQDLLDLSRLETESLPERIEPVELKAQVFKLVDAFALKARTKQLSLHIEIPDELPLLRIAENHLGQLLTNLLGNAIAYTPAQGRVLVSAKLGGAVSEKRMVHVLVRDNGPGIPQEEQDKVFDRFYRGQAVQLNREVPGTGLGLAICKEIVERYGGRITLTSVVGEGTTFMIKLPIAN